MKFVSWFKSYYFVICAMSIYLFHDQSLKIEIIMSCVCLLMVLNRIRIFPAKYYWRLRGITAGNIDQDATTLSRMLICSFRLTRGALWCWSYNTWYSIRLLKDPDRFLLKNTCQEIFRMICIHKQKQIFTIVNNYIFCEILWHNETLL